MTTESVISEDQLAIDWTLTEEDMNFVTSNSRGPNQNLKFAAQLCYLRRYGVFISSHHDVPMDAISYLAKQFNLQLVNVLNFSKNTYSYTWEDKICDYLDYRKYSEINQTELESWIVNKICMETLNRDHLIALVIENLKEIRVVLPSPIVLGRLINKLINQALDKFYRKINQTLPKEKRDRLNLLLVPEEKGAESDFSKLKQYPGNASSQVMNQFLDYFNKIESIGILDCNLTTINPDVITELAKKGKYFTASQMRNIRSNSKRQAILICFLHVRSKIILDYIVDIYKTIFTDINRKANHEVSKIRDTNSKKNKGRFKPAGDFIKKAFSQARVANLSLTEFIKQFDEIQMLETAEACECIDALEKTGVVDHIVSRLNYVRQFSKSFLNLDLKAKRSKSLLTAMDIIKKLHTGEINKLPEDAPVSFLTPMWQSYLYDEEGKIKAKHWEMGFYYVLKKRMSSGDVYLNDSQNNRYFWDTFAPTDSQNYENIRLNIPNDFDDLINGLHNEYQSVASLANISILNNDFSKIEDNNLVLTKEDALEISPEVRALRKLIQVNMPNVRIEQLAAQALNFSECSKAFTSFQNPSTFKEFPRKPLIAAIVAHATNIGLLDMGSSAVGVTADALHYASTTYLRAETIQEANKLLINKFLSYPISKELQDGSYSTSDAQRYAVEVSCLLSGYYPRYYGYYEKVLSIYTHQCKGAVFGQNVISCGEREASYVLTNLLENKTNLNPECHSTDTHGFTEHIFALCYLLGFGFHPRLKDLAEQRLYRIKHNYCYENIDGLFTSSINLEDIRKHWDEIVRITHALKSGLAPAHIIIQKLANRTDSVSKAIKSLGRVVKTIYILRYISDKDLRYKVHMHLNQGESRHQLAKKLFFLNRGVFKTGDLEEIMNKASCLSLLSNAILLWNTHHIQQIVNQLRENGHDIKAEHLQKISALMFKHVQIHGTYHFENI